MEHPQVEEKRVKTSNQAETYRECRKITKEADRLVKDVRENVGAPSNLCR